MTAYETIAIAVTAEQLSLIGQVNISLDGNTYDVYYDAAGYYIMIPFFDPGAVSNDGTLQRASEANWVVKSEDDAYSILSDYTFQLTYVLVVV